MHRGCDSPVGSEPQANRLDVMTAKLEELLEVEVRQATGQRFQTDEAIDIGGDDRPIQAVGALYIGPAATEAQRSRACAGEPKLAPEKALGANRLKTRKGRLPLS